MEQIPRQIPCATSFSFPLPRQSSHNTKNSYINCWKHYIDKNKVTKKYFTHHPHETQRPLKYTAFPLINTALPKYKIKKNNKLYHWGACPLKKISRISQKNGTSVLISPSWKSSSYRKEEIQKHVGSSRVYQRKGWMIDR